MTVKEFLQIEPYPDTSVGIHETIVAPESDDESGNKHAFVNRDL